MGYDIYIYSMFVGLKVNRCLGINMKEYVGGILSYGFNHYLTRRSLYNKPQHFLNSNLPLAQIFQIFRQLTTTTGN